MRASSHCAVAQINQRRFLRVSKCLRGQEALGLLSRPAKDPFDPTDHSCICDITAAVSTVFDANMAAPVPASRPLSDQTVFSSVAWLLRSAHEQGDCTLPRSALRSALYLLAATQDKSPDLDEVKLSVVSLRRAAD